jgi:hypothetical protein
MPKPQLENLGPTPIRDQAWAAGLFEGEGWLSVTKKGGRWKMAIEMTDRDVIEAFHEVIEVGNFTGPNKRPSSAPHHLPYYSWAVTKKDDIFHAICELYPYMGERRRAKFDEFLTTYGN